MEQYYYKILSDDLIHHGFKYHRGLNVDTKDFDETPICGGGLFFADKNHIFDFIGYGSKIAKIRIPKSEKIVKVDNKYKSHSLEILEIHRINTKTGINFMKREGVDID